MQLQNMMQNVSSISLADTEGHYLRAPKCWRMKIAGHLMPNPRPWFIKQAEVSSFSLYTPPYIDYFTHHPTITLYKPVITPMGRLKGNLAFHLDLISMGYALRQMVAPCRGSFVVQRDGKVVLHPDPGALFKPPCMSSALMDRMTSGEGQLYDEDKDVWYYYYSFTNPDWFIIYRVDNSTLINLTRHETDIVAQVLLWPRSSSYYSACTCAMHRVPC